MNLQIYNTGLKFLYFCTVGKVPQKVSLVDVISQGQSVFPLLHQKVKVKGQTNYCQRQYQSAYS